MKRCLVILLLLCLLAPAAQAVQAPVSDLAALTSYRDMEITGFVQPGGGDWAFLALKDRQTNYLAGFNRQDGAWQEQFLSLTALPRGDMMIRLTDCTGTAKITIRGEEFFFDEEYYGTAFASYWSNGEYHENFSLFQQDQAGRFQLVHYANAGHSGLINLSADELVFYAAYEQVQRVWLSIQREVSRFNLEKLPRNPRQAHEPDVLPPALPEGWLSVREVTLSGTDLIPVYSAPDNKALRLAGGKAAVSPRGWALALGTEGDYTLILYGINPRHYRAGYIKSSLIPEHWVLAPLAFTPTPARVTKDVPAFDGLNTLSEPFLKLRTGQQVTLLSRIGDFSYFETTQGGKPCRAIASLNAFDTDPEPPQGHATADIQTAYGREQLLLTPLELPGFPKLWHDARLFWHHQPNDQILRFDAANNPFQAQISLTITQAQPQAQLKDLEQEYQGQGYTLTPTTHQNILPGFIAAKEDQRIETYLKDSPQGRYQFTFVYPERAADTWGLRLKNILDTAEMGGF